MRKMPKTREADPQPLISSLKLTLFPSMGVLQTMSLQNSHVEILALKVMGLEYEDFAR